MSEKVANGTVTRSMRLCILSKAKSVTLHLTYLRRMNSMDCCCKLDSYLVVEPFGRCLVAFPPF